MGVVPTLAGVAVGVDVVLHGPVAAGTAVEGEVVEAVGLVAAEEVGQVDHEVKCGTDVAHAGLVVVGGLVGVGDHAETLVGHTFEPEPLDTYAGTEYGGKPLTYIEVDSGSETILEVAHCVVVREIGVDTTLSCDKPVALEAVDEDALCGIFDILHFLSLLGHERHARQSKCACKQSNLFHKNYSYLVCYLIEFKRLKMPYDALRTVSGGIIRVLRYEEKPILALKNQKNL